MSPIPDKYAGTGSSSNKRGNVAAAGALAVPADAAAAPSTTLSLSALQAHAAAQDDAQASQGLAAQVAQGVIDPISFEALHKPTGTLMGEPTPGATNAEELAQLAQVGVVPQSVVEAIDEGVEPGPHPEEQHSEGLLKLGPEDAANASVGSESLLSTGDTSLSTESSSNTSVLSVTSGSEPMSLTSTISRGTYHQCGTARRVKVYELKNEVWFDHGTGYCAGVYDEEQDQALLLAKAEEYCRYISISATASPKPAPAEAQQPQQPPQQQQQDQSEAADKAGEGEGDGTQTKREAKPIQVGAAGDEQTLADQFIIVVSDQLDAREVLLCTSIVREEIFQRQQGASRLSSLCRWDELTDSYQSLVETLIVWTDPDGKDMALSFQESEGCNEIWEFLCEVQKHFKSAGELVR